MSSITPTEEQSDIMESVRGANSVMVEAYAGTAKALRADQRVLTPTGFRAISELTVGDMVIGKNGLPYPVLGVYPQGIRPLFEVVFSDRSSVIATGDHLWNVRRTDHKQFIKMTLQLAAKPRMKSGPAASWGDGTRAYWFFPMCQPVRFSGSFERTKLPVDPWLLGVLLGDGNLRQNAVLFSSADAQIVEDVKVIVAVDYDLNVKKTAERGYDYRISSDISRATNPLLGAMRALGLADTLSQFKFVPNLYLRADVSSRLSILQGLLDTDGTVSNGLVSFTTTSSALAGDVKFLVESLGGTAVLGQFTTTHLLAFRLYIKLPHNMKPFRLLRKLDLYKPGQREPYRALESITQVEDGEAICISVESPDNLFLTENFIPTHNTTTIKLAGAGIKTPALAVAFNKAIAEDLRKALPVNFTVKTMNGLGFEALRRALPAVKKWDIDARKLGKIISSVAKASRTSLAEEDWDLTRQLVTGAQLAGLRPESNGAWADLATDLMIDASDQDRLIDLGKNALSESNAQIAKGHISFDDQVYFPIAFDLDFIRWPRVFVDESQDLSPLNHKMVSKSLRDDGYLVSVGDSCQAIYAFRGADAESMKSIRQLRLPSKWVDRRLTMTFRCPRRVVERQQSHAPGYRAAEANANGLVLDFKDLGRPWTWADIVASRAVGAGSTAVLCRNNAPLMRLAFALLRKGIGITMLGRDIGRALIVLSKQIISNDHAPSDECRGAIGEWIISESSAALANGQDHRVDAITDRGEALLAVLDSSGARDAAELRGAIEALFARIEGQATLGSIHRAKGLEWDTVVHLDPWRIPSRFARADPTQMTQELNLRYVCETRTRFALIEADLEDFDAS